MKRSFSQFLAAVILVSMLFFTACTKDSATTTESATEEAAISGSSAQSSGSSEAGGYTFREIEVELNDIGRNNLIETGRSRAVQNATGIYVTDVNNPWVPPLDPIVCDGMTYSQIWVDISQKLNNFLNSPAGQAAQDYANATCRPVYYGASNCAVCVIAVIRPQRPCFDMATEMSHTTRIKAQLFEQAP